MSSSTSVINAEQAKIIAIRACDNDENVQVVDFKLLPYSKNKVGFMGSHEKLEIRIKRKGSNETETLNFFVKSVPQDSVDQMEFVKQRRVFNQEAEFFTKLMPQLLESISSGDIEAWAPECYLANENIVVLEDLRDKGYQMSASKTLTTEKLILAARTMARMHAASIITEKKLGKPLNELYPQACAEHIFRTQIRDYGRPLFESLIKKVAKRVNRPCCKDLTTPIYRAVDFVSEHGGNRVICHGDAWPNNVMINDDDKCLLVDYQITRYASRMFDVAELICLSTHREDRDRDEKIVVKAYWETLTETLSKCEPSIDKPTYDELIDEYYEAKHSALFLGVVYLPTTILSDEVFAKYKDDTAALYQKYIFRRNNDCIVEMMDQDEEYCKRITEVVLNFIESCEKIADDKE